MASDLEFCYQEWDKFYPISSTVASHTEFAVRPISLKRKAEIETFSGAVRAAGERLAPSARDAERIRLLAQELQAGVPAVKKWWYGQNAPRGAAAVAILRELDFMGVIDANEIFEACVTHCPTTRM